MLKAESNRRAWVRILAVFAHPDDEVFCAGGTLALYAASGVEVMVVSATRGEAGQIRDARVATRRTLGDVRAQELSRSCQALGVAHALCLDYGDGKLGDADLAPLTAQLVTIIRTFRPDVVITFGPDGAYGHPDHVAISAMTTQAFHLAGDTSQFPLQTSGDVPAHSPARLYYSYFPRSQKLLSARLVQWLVDLRERFRGSAEFAHALLLFSAESTMLGYSNDYSEVVWFPKGFYIVEQDESASKLYLILSGRAEVIREAEDGSRQLAETLTSGDFFGYEELAQQQAYTHHVVAVESVTCLVFAPEKPSNAAGRGADASPHAAVNDDENQPFDAGRATTVLDIGDYLPQKIAAMAAHRTQFSVDITMFPYEALQDLFGKEYFVQAYPKVKLATSLFNMSDLLYARN